MTISEILHGFTRAGIVKACNERGMRLGFPEFALIEHECGEVIVPQEFADWQREATQRLKDATTQPEAVSALKELRFFTEQITGEAVRRHVEKKKVPN